MKIMRDKTYNILMDKVKKADAFIEALQDNKIYTKPVKITGYQPVIQGCFFIGTKEGECKTLLTIHALTEE